MRSSFAVAALLFCLCASSVAQTVVPIRVTNMSARVRTCWVDVAVPMADADRLPKICRVDPQGWMAIKGSKVGLHSQMFHILATLGGDASVQGDLKPYGAQPRLPRFQASEWIHRDPAGILVEPAVLVGGQTRRVVAPVIEVVENEDVRQVLRYRGRLENTPLVFEAHYYIYAKQDAVRFECTITNSDLTDPALTFDIGHLWFESGQHLALDYRVRFGMPEPQQFDASGASPMAGKWVQYVTGSRPLGRAESLFFTGQVAPLPDTGSASTGSSFTLGTQTVRQTLLQRVESLRAALEGPAVAVAQNWDGRWLSFGWAPEIPHGQGDGWAEANRRHADFVALMAQPADLFTNRPLGLDKHARTTGAQEDFGAAKGAMAVRVGDPRYIHHAFYSMSEFLRPFHNREPSGAPLQQSNYVGLQTWDQVINCRTTAHFLGLQCPLPYSWPNSGFGGIDDQHRSQNNFHALLALTGSYALRGCLRDYLEIDLTQVPGWLGAPRAIGRLYMCWASMYLLLDNPNDRARLLTHMTNKLATIEQRWTGAPFVNDPQRTLRALSIGQDPTFRDPAGQAIPSVIVWEHSIAAMGLYAAFKVTGNPRYEAMIRHVAGTVVNHSIFQEGGRWHCCIAVRYRSGANEGVPFPASSYTTAPSNSDILVGNSFWVWILPAVQVLKDLGGNSPALDQRLTSILQDVAPNGATTWPNACWWAAADW